MIVVAPDVGEELVAALDDIGLCDESLKECEFFLGKIVFCLAVGEFEAGWVNGELVPMNLLLRRVCRSASAEQGMHSGHDLLNSEGLGHVVVSAGGESLNLVSFLTFGAEHEDGKICVVLAEGATYFKAVLSGHHDIENQEGWAFIEDALFDLISMISSSNPEAFSGQKLGQSQ